MRKSPFRIHRCSVGGLVLSGALVWLPAQAVPASNTDTLSLTVLIVDELEACRPDGYRHYGDDPSGEPSCQPLTAELVRSWVRDNVLSNEIRIPPQRIPVGRLLPFLRSYLSIDVSSLDSTDRKSAVFLFSWSEPQHLDIKFRRESRSASIPSTDWRESRLEGDRHWIHHERADSLAPAYRIEWVLVAGDEEIRLRATERLNDP